MMMAPTTVEGMLDGERKGKGKGRAEGVSRWSSVGKKRVSLQEAFGFLGRTPPRRGSYLSEGNRRLIRSDPADFEFGGALE